MGAVIIYQVGYCSSKTRSTQYTYTNCARSAVNSNGSPYFHFKHDKTLKNRQPKNEILEAQVTFKNHLKHKISEN